MKKEYKRPSIEVVKIEQVLLQTISGEGITGGSGNNGNQPNYAPGYGGKGRGRYAEDDLDEEEEEF
jgi:hypothetical protein